MKTFICKRCGVEFVCEGSYAKYCGECRVIIKRERDKISSMKRSMNGGRHTGERKLYTFRCEMCGQEAKARGKSAKHCENCRHRQRQNWNAEGVGRRTGREVFKKTCAVCGLPFSTIVRDATKCVVCTKGDRLVGAKKASCQPSSPPPALTLAEQMREVERYNREHGTNLSYGKYMTMMRVRSGEAHVEVKV